MKIIDKCHIYILTSPSGKKYVGQTYSLRKRFNSYENGGKISQIKLYRAIEKYGWDNFTKEVLDFYNLTQIELDELEIKYIKEFDSFNNGYNCTIGGLGKRIHYTEEERKLAKLYREAKYRNGNRDKIKVRNKKYYTSELGIKTQKDYYLKYYAENKEHVTERNKKYIEDHREEHLARRRRYYQKNKERERQRTRDWRERKKVTDDK